MYEQVRESPATEIGRRSGRKRHTNEPHGVIEDKFPDHLRHPLLHPLWNLGKGSAVRKDLLFVRICIAVTVT